ncbi:MAG TPA: FAD-dependent 5-carboxymethylaminomethyl-2-thiouridine(34) oxidoreductase MnmC [Caulobacteraceae bacterium]
MDRPPSPLSFDTDGQPRSRRFGDVYFSKSDGLAESRAVFLSGCGLPERWAGRRRFTVAELGFGTGLNIAALLDLWRRERPAGGQLHIFSVEREPVDGADAARVLGLWPELAEVAAPLLARWPGRAAGFHRIDLPELGARLDLAVMDAEAALGAWRGRADAWFLDGFAPAANPDMWSEALLRLVGERSAPGALVGTYTVAGAVRRRLADAGFAVERRPGFGAKRQRLEARWPRESPAEAPLPRVAIVGAGIAGAALAWALRALGAEPQVFDRAGPGTGASGNPGALVTPRLDAGLGPAAQLHAQAFARAVRLYGDMPGVVAARGVLQLESGRRDAQRFAAIAASDLFEPDTLACIDATEAAARLGEPATGGLLQHEALVIDPAPVLAAWLGAVTTADVASVVRAETGWRLLDAGGALIAEADAVCLAPGASLAALAPDLPLQAVRGQLNWTPSEHVSATAWGAYAAPLPTGGLMFGATHDRDDASDDHRPADDARNFAALAARLPQLAARIDPASLGGRASVRAATTDQLPIAGALAEGLFVLGGLGSRGFCLTPLLAEHVAALVCGAPSPLPAGLATVVAPERFAQRARRRSGRFVGAPAAV